ncbi:MAG: hypothetical protein JJT94_00510 [Bernardetiaceae bacterium]|nr:hypothetical protein [Bernardetiaceae bacterium]
MTNSLKIGFLLSLLIAFFSLQSFTTSSSEEKIIEKARAAVAAADANDWETYAKSAQKCARRNINLEEAQEWIAKSIAIRKTSKNLEIQGDVFKAQGKYEEAVKSYLESMELVRNSNIFEDVTTLQKKIAFAQAKR